MTQFGKWCKRIGIAICAVGVIGALWYGMQGGFQNGLGNRDSNIVGDGSHSGAASGDLDGSTGDKAEGMSDAGGAGEGASESAVTSESKPKKPDPAKPLLDEAKALVKQYDYDGAIRLLKKSPYAEKKSVKKAIDKYRKAKKKLVKVDVTKVTHIFFHSLIVDTKRAFSSKQSAQSYNQVMTTVEEFKEIIKEMYKSGYVMVALHDLAEIQVDADGKEHMVVKDLYLPKGKKAFVMSQDDVCYYEYMKGDGFATKMILDKDGTPICEYKDARGKVHKGAYDLVPILDNFVKKHPDFSYKGAKAVLAFTGYNGILGYRTDETYDADSPYCNEPKPNKNIKKDRKYVKKLTKALKADGYELASHSWGHRDYGTISYDKFKTDVERWERNVEPLLPEPCDIILYPFGADIANEKGYFKDNKRYTLLREKGFRYYCNVDSSKYWVQVGSDYFRQGRRNVDGYRMWMAYSGKDDRLSDLIDVKKVFDKKNRPTPIDWR